MLPPDVNISNGGFTADNGKIRFGLNAVKNVGRNLIGDNKELLIIPGANHTDLYDQIDIIPFGKLKAFFEEYLK